ncbi:MAG: ABC transporter ATP-binding protein [Acidimicrobiia bacterium]|nr:ATP-binding cassette domain-containing protein [Acidimicrobiia bacterium]NNL14944.1 ABC transporter ATP-binding protein [Acidimicrobiia bacterium]RZV44582.1 MAG: ABC transporter ATP-binding protein [Acidimicrobiia bacterium]
MLRLNDLHKRYGPVAALAGCTFDLERGQLLGFLGPNGAGKTTAMRSVFGLVVPDSGSVTWNGAEIGPEERLRFGYMPEQRGLYPRMKVQDQLVYFGRLHGMSSSAAAEATDRWLAVLGLTDRAGSRLEELSHGNQQRIQLAAALVHAPELLVLDEPFSGLDPLGVETMADLLRSLAEEGVAVMFSSHQLDLVEDLCEQVVIIHQGAIVLEGAVRALRTASSHRYLEVELRSGDTSWADDLPGVEQVERSESRLRLTASDEADLEDLARRAVAAGEVTQFSFEPPSLSEVFREAVQQ